MIFVACSLCFRLALERADTPSKAVDVLAELLVIHGQGGADCEHASGLICQNSFLIANQSEAWVFETAGRHWAAKRIKSMIYSNCYLCFILERYSIFIYHMCLFYAVQ